MKRLSFFHVTGYKLNSSSENHDFSFCLKPIFIELLESDQSANSKFSIVGHLPSFFTQQIASFDSPLEFEFLKRELCISDQNYLHYSKVPVELLESNQPTESYIYLNESKDPASIAFKITKDHKTQVIEFSNDQNFLTLSPDIFVVTDEIVNLIRSSKSPLYIKDIVDWFDNSDFYCDEQTIKTVADMMEAISGGEIIRIIDGEVIIPGRSDFGLQDYYEERLNWVHLFSTPHIKEYFENDF